MHFTIIPFAAALALPLGPYSHVSCRLYVTIHCSVFEKFIAISCYFTFASTRNIWLSAVWLSATPIISGNFQTHARRAHLSSDLILYACSNIHLSGSRHVQLTADILRPRHPANNQTLVIICSSKCTSTCSAAVTIVYVLFLSSLLSLSHQSHHSGPAGYHGHELSSLQSVNTFRWNFYCSRKFKRTSVQLSRIRYWHWLVSYFHFSCGTHTTLAFHQYCYT